MVVPWISETVMRGEKEGVVAWDIWKRLFPARRSRSGWLPNIRMGNNINLFKLCSGLRVLGYLMILLFGAIVALTYYAVVFITWGPLLFFSSPLRIPSFFILLLFHTLLLLLTWSYLMVLLNDPGSNILPLLLFSLPEWEASSLPPLLYLPKVRSQDGPSLHLGRQLCWGT